MRLKKFFTNCPFVLIAVGLLGRIFFNWYGSKFTVTTLLKPAKLPLACEGRNILRFLS